MTQEESNLLQKNTYLMYQQLGIRGMGVHIEIYANVSGWGWILTKCGGNGSTIKEIEDCEFLDSYEEALRVGINEARKHLNI